MSLLRMLAIAAIVLSGLGVRAAAQPDSNARPNRASPPQRTSGRRAADNRRMPPPVAPTEVTDAAFNGCNKVPRGKRVVHVGLPPDTDVNHLIAWISSLTCKPFVYAFDTTSHNRNVTLIAPKVVTPEEAFGIVYDSLDSVGLTLRPVGDFFQIIESQAAHTGPIPVYDFDGHRIRDEPRSHR